ncbi:MAG: hypothetical protein U0V49_02065 [Saprospiraceae bacterium]
MTNQIKLPYCFFILLFTSLNYACLINKNPIELENVTILKKYAPPGMITVNAVQGYSVHRKIINFRNLKAQEFVKLKVGCTYNAEVQLINIDENYFKLISLK